MPLPLLFTLWASEWPDIRYKAFGLRDAMTLRGRGLLVFIRVLIAFCHQSGLLRVEAAGLARDALYLLRPDTYVALAEPSGATAALDAYFALRAIKAGGA